MVEVAVHVRLVTLGMTAVTVVLVMFVMEVVVEDALLELSQIQNKRNAFATKVNKYLLMDNAYVSVLTLVTLISIYALAIRRKREPSVKYLLMYQESSTISAKSYSIVSAITKLKNISTASSLSR